jgi:pantoate--beta-alanine ligase
MELVETIVGARDRTRDLLRRGSVGFVPTMGALHAGHMSLVAASRKNCRATAVSIFVNPLQFGPSEDLQRYPRTIDADLGLLRDAGVDFVFAPSVDEMERAANGTFVEPGPVARRWEGERRPGHFRGVATVVLKLLQIIPATDAYFGQKDFQQWRVVQTMVEDLQVPVQLHMGPTVRESDGLAMSSRNRYLSPSDRSKALGLSRALANARQASQRGVCATEQLEQILRETLAEHRVDAIDYAVVVDRSDLEPLIQVDRPAVMLLAARVGTTRLLDNGLLPQHAEVGHEH